MDSGEDELEVVPSGSILNIHNISVDVGHNGFSSSLTFYTPRLDSSNGCDVRDSANATTAQANVDATHHFSLSLSHLSKPAISMQRLREIREERLATLDRLGIAVPSRETNPELTHHLPPIGRHKSYVGRFNSNPSTPHGIVSAPTVAVDVDASGDRSRLAVPKPKTDSQATASSYSRENHTAMTASSKDNRSLDLDVCSSGTAPTSTCSPSSASSTSSAFTARDATPAFNTNIVFSPKIPISTTAPDTAAHMPDATASHANVISANGTTSTSNVLHVSSATAAGDATSANAAAVIVSAASVKHTTLPGSAVSSDSTVVGVPWNHLLDARKYTPQWPASVPHTASTHSTTSSTTPSSAVSQSTPIPSSATAPPASSVSLRARPASQRVRGGAPRSNGLAGTSSTPNPAPSVATAPRWQRSATLPDTQHAHTAHSHTHTHIHPQSPPHSHMLSSTSSRIPTRTTAFAHHPPAPMRTPSGSSTTHAVPAAPSTHNSFLSTAVPILPATVSSLDPASPAAASPEATTYSLPTARTAVVAPATVALPTSTGALSSSSAPLTPSPAVPAAPVVTPAAPVAGWSTVPRTPPLRPSFTTTVSAKYVAEAPFMPGAVSARAGTASTHAAKTDRGGSSHARTPAAPTSATSVAGVDLRSGARGGDAGVRTGKETGRDTAREMERMRANRSVANSTCVSQRPSTSIYASTPSSTGSSSITGKAPAEADSAAAVSALVASRTSSASLLSCSRPRSAATRTTSQRPVEASREDFRGVKAHPHSLGNDRAQPRHRHHAAIGTRLYSASACGSPAGTCSSPASARVVSGTAPVDIYPTTHKLTPLQSEVLQSLREACGSYLLHPCTVPQTSAAVCEPHGTMRVREGAPRTAPRGKRDAMSFSRAAAILAAPRATDLQAEARSRPPSATTATASPRTVLVELERRLVTARALLKDTSSAFCE